MPSSTKTQQAVKPRERSSRQAFLDDVFTGLRSTPKQLPCKYFYDERGSMLFDRICGLDEYYLTNAELSLTERFAAEMGERLGPGTMLVEYGSGSSIKTRDLLDGLIEPAAYVPVDISGEHLRKTAIALARAYPQIEILPVCADFTQPFDLPQPMQEPRQISVYFPGSTIGNFLPDQAARLLRRIVETCGSGGGLLIGIDLKKNVARIEAAYNDREGVTAAFNLNLLKRINRELGADFDLANFSHRAHYNHERGRIEMHLVSESRQRVHLAGESFDFVPGETICTEYSHKYTVDEFSAVASTVGLRLDREWTDDNRDFAVLYYTMTK